MLLILYAFVLGLVVGVGLERLTFGLTKAQQVQRLTAAERALRGKLIDLELHRQ